jgi:hypothetical protein
MYFDYPDDDSSAKKDILDSRMKHGTRPAAKPDSDPSGYSRSALALRPDRLNKSEESAVQTDEPLSDPRAPTGAIPDPRPNKGQTTTSRRWRAIDLKLHFCRHRAEQREREMTGPEDRGNNKKLGYLTLGNLA